MAVCGASACSYWGSDVTNRHSAQSVTSSLSSPCRLMRNRQSAALHRERQRALVEGLYGRVNNLLAERDTLRQELARVAAAGVKVSLPPPAILPPLVPEVDLANGVDPDGLDSASHLTQILKSGARAAKQGKAPPTLTAPVAAPAGQGRRPPAHSAPSPRTSDPLPTPGQTAPRSVTSEGGSEASDPHARVRRSGGSPAQTHTSAGSSDEDEAKIGTESGEHPAALGAAVTDKQRAVAAFAAALASRPDVVFSSQFATQDAMGIDSVDYESGSDDPGAMGDVLLEACRSGGLVGAGGQDLLDVALLGVGSDAEDGLDVDLTGGDVHSSGVPSTVPRDAQFSVDASHVPGASAPMSAETAQSHPSHAFLSTLAFVAMLAVLSGPTLLAGVPDAGSAVGALTGVPVGVASAAASLASSVMSAPASLPLLSGLLASLQHAAATRDAMTPLSGASTTLTSPSLESHALQLEQAEAELAKVHARMAQGATDAPLDADAAASLVHSAETVAKAADKHHDATTPTRSASVLPPRGGARRLATVHEPLRERMSLGDGESERVLHFMRLLRPVFKPESAHGTPVNATRQGGLRGGKQQHHVGGMSHPMSVATWQQGREEYDSSDTDESLLTQLPLLQAPSGLRPAAAPPTSGGDRGLVPYGSPVPSGLLLPGADGSVSRLHLFRVGLMLGTLHGIDAASAAEWAGAAPTWSLVEASAVQQLAVLAAPMSRADQTTLDTHAWKVLARAALQLRRRVDDALSRLGEDHAPSHAQGTGSGAEGGVLMEFVKQQHEQQHGGSVQPPTSSVNASASLDHVKQALGHLLAS